MRKIVSAAALLLTLSGAGVAAATTAVAAPAPVNVSASQVDPLQTTLEAVVKADTVDALKPLTLQLVADLTYAKADPALIANLSTAAKAFNESGDPAAIAWWHDVAKKLLKDIYGIG